MGVVESNKIKYSLLLVLVAGLVGVVIFLTGNNTGQSLEHYNDCPETDLSCIATRTVAEADKIGGRGSLYLLTEYMKQNKITPEECHTTLHKVGEEFYKKFKEESYYNNKGLCHGSYYHGVLIGLIGDKTPETGTELIEMVEGMCSQIDEVNFMICMHGLGHASYRYYNGSVFRATNLCQEAGRERIITSCTAGLFMEIASNELQKKGAPNSLRYYDPKDCTKFKEAQLVRACLIQVAMVLHSYGESLVEVCGGMLQPWDRSCRTSYGVITAIDLIGDWGNSEGKDVRVGGEKKSNLYEECLSDGWCAIGFYQSIGAESGTKEETRRYCTIFVEKYGNPDKVSTCIRSATLSMMDKLNEKNSRSTIYYN